jgi:hypothetical protein
MTFFNTEATPIQDGSPHANTLGQRKFKAAMARMIRPDFAGGHHFNYWIDRSAKDQK